MARTRQTPRKKKVSSPKKGKKAQSGQGQPSAESSEAMDTSKVSQTCEKPSVIQDPPTSAQEQQKVGEEETNVHQELESGSDLQKDTAQTKSPVAPQEENPPEETAGRKRKKEDDDDVSAPVGQNETETATSPKKTKLSEGSKDSECSDSEQLSKEEVKCDSKQVESTSDKSGGGTCEVEKVGGDSDEAPEDLSMAEGKEIAMEQKRDESVQAQRIQQEARERRRKKDEQYKMQKDARRSRELEKFPEEGLKEVAKRAAVGKALQKNQKKAKTKRKKSDQVNTAPTESNNSSLSVVALDTSQQAVAPSYEEARDFLHQNLYGDRHKRIPVLSFQAQKYIEQPAKNFTS